MSAIKSITVKIGDSEHTMTIEEARGLHKALGELFEPASPIYIERPVWVERPWPSPYRPTPYWYWTCGTGSDEPYTLSFDSGTRNP
jgi:hypothetical protein